MKPKYVGDPVEVTVDALTHNASDWNGVVPAGTTGAFISVGFGPTAGVALISPNRPDDFPGLRHGGHLAIPFTAIEKADE